MPTHGAATTVIVVTWRGATHIGACLDALGAQRRPHRVLVVDNASDDGTAAVLAAHPTAPEVVRQPRNTGYAGGIAAGCARARTPLLAWLNDDARPAPDWLEEMENALRPDVGAVAARLYRVDGQRQSTGGALTVDGHGRDRTTSVGEPFAFCGGAALLRASALREAGGVAERFFCYYEDTDTAWRLRLTGWRVVAAGSARVTHLHGSSTRPGSVWFHHWNERNRLLMLLRCAPGSVALRELCRFAALTMVLPVRRTVPATANFRCGLRLRVLAEVLAALPDTIRARREIGARARHSRRRIWQRWAGR